MAIRNEPRRASHATRAVAIDIGSTLVRAVEIEIRGDEARFLKRGSAPAPANLWDNLEANRDKLALAIRDALTSGGITATSVVTTLPRRFVTLKYARLPHASAEQVRGMIAFEAQQYIPFPIEEVIIDHQIVSDEMEELTTVMIVAARKALIDGYLAAFDKANLTVDRLTVSALALAEHALNHAAPVALMEADEAELDVAVVAAGKLLFTRAAVLPEKSASNGHDPLADEMARSLAAYQNEYRTQPVTGLMVAGVRDRVERIEATLGSTLGLSVERLSGTLLPAGDAEALGYATALGAALQKDGNSLAAVNLVPKERDERKQAARRMATTTAVGVLGIVCIVALVIYMAHSLTMQRKERVLADTANHQLGTVNEVLKRTQDVHDKLVETNKTVTSSLNNQIEVVDVVKVVSDVLPKNSGIYLTQLSYERGGVLAIHGNAKNELAATDLVLALQATGAFGEVRLGYLGDAQAESTTGGPNGMQTKLKPGELMSFIIACKNPLTDVILKSATSAPSITATKEKASTTTAPGKVKPQSADAKAEAPLPQIRSTRVNNNGHLAIRNANIASEVR